MYIEDCTVHWDRGGIIVYKFYEGLGIMHTVLKSFLLVNNLIRVSLKMECFLSCVDTSAVHVRVRMQRPDFSRPMNACGTL